MALPNISLKRTRREASLVYAGIPAARRLASPLDVLLCIGVRGLRGCHRHSLGHACWVPSFKVSGTTKARAVSPPTFKASGWHHALRARTADRCPPIEENPWSRRRAVKLRASRSLDPHPRPLPHKRLHRPIRRSLRANPELSLPWPAVLGGTWRAAVEMHPALCDPRHHKSAG
jgi:hypothetical protein